MSSQFKLQKHHTITGNQFSLTHKKDNSDNQDRYKRAVRQRVPNWSGLVNNDYFEVIQEHRLNDNNKEPAQVYGEIFAEIN